MALFVKICGLSERDSVDAAVTAGADALGFVFAESPRRVTPSRAAALTADLPAHVRKVAVMRHPLPEEWREVAKVFQPDWLQSDAGDFSSLEIDRAVQRLPVYRDQVSLDETVLGTEELVVFEAAESGVGQKANWDRAARLAAKTKIILAGGLNPDNVATAIERVQPFGVDVSSGVESSRGKKDAKKIAAFIAAARAMEK